MWIAIQNAVGARQGVGGGPGPTPPYTPPLDSIDSVAAYSVRKLRTDYSGPCMEVYRVSDGATTDIGFDSQGLLATADIVSFASGSQVLVSTWYNQGTSGPDAVALSGERPEIYTGTSIRVMGGKPALYPQNAAVGFTDIPINISNLQPEPWTHWTNFSVSKAANNFGLFSVFVNPNRRINLVVPFVPTSNDGALQGIAIDTTGTGGIYYQGVDRGTFVTRGDTLAQFEEYQTISNIVALATNSATADLNDMTLGATTYFGTGEYSMHIMQEVMVIPYLSLTGYNQALDINANNYYQITNLPDYTSGFLADYSGAAVAYSVRKLSNTAIKALRVRRTVAPFDEQDIGFTAGGDLDEAAIVAFGGSDPLVVSRWYDQSGFSRHAVQDTPGSQPTIYNGTVVITENGKPAVTFNSDKLVTSSITNTDLCTTNAHTSVTVFNDTSSSGFKGVWGTDDRVIDFVTRLGNTNWQYSYGSGATPELRGYTAPASDYNRQNLSTVFKGSTNGYWRLNGSQIDSGAGGTTVNTGTTNLELGESVNLGFTGNLQEVISWPTDNYDNRTAIEENINDYYTVIINPDAATSGFLFDYQNAETAYSVRQLNNNAEYCMQVERSDGRTMNIGFVAGDLDTQAIIDFAGANPATVSRWYDQTGNQNHSVQDISIRQPEIYNGVSVFTDNGKPAVRFTDPGQDSNRDTLVWSSNVDTQLFSWSCVAGFSPSGALRTAFHQDNTGASNYLRVDTGGYVIVKPNDFDFLNGSTFDGTQKLNTVIRSSATTATSYQDGSQTGTISTLDASNIVWGTTDSNITGSGVLSFNAQEIILWDVDKNAAGERTGIELNIMTYYGIP